MAFRNMNPDTCAFVNMESKPLPFINNFTHYCTPENYQICYQKLVEYATDDTVTEVVLDSLSSYPDSVIKYARSEKRGYEIWNFYNEEVGKLLYLFKKYPKDIIVTAHYEWVETGDAGAIEKRIAVKAKEWKGMIEKDFTIVHFANMTVVDGKRNYFIELNSDGKSSAKTPPMFLKEGEEKIENDYSVFLERVRQTLKQE